MEYVRARSGSGGAWCHCEAGFEVWRELPGASGHECRAGAHRAALPALRAALQVLENHRTTQHQRPSLNALNALSINAPCLPRRCWRTTALRARPAAWASTPGRPPPPPARRPARWSSSSATSTTAGQPVICVCFACWGPCAMLGAGQGLICMPWTHRPGDLHAWAPGHGSV